MMTRNECARYLADRDHFAILTHGKPDGDTVGSAALLCLGLRALGRTAHVLADPEISPFLARLLTGLTKEEPEEQDTLVSVDTASPGMLPSPRQALVGRIGLRIDHHGNGTAYTPLELVDGKSASCGEIIYDILTELGVELTKDMAKALYVALSTDTGCFRYANTNAHCYEVAAACAATGANLYPITQELFDTNTLGKLKIQSYILEHALFLHGGQAAVCAIPRELEETVSKEDMEGVPGFLRSIEGVKISATIRQTETGSKMSVRAIPGYDAAAVCARFGGGGHKGAAGAGLDVPLEEAAELAAKALEAIFED